MSQAKRILALYVAHRSHLVTYAAGITGDRAIAEDVVQEAWTRIALPARVRPLEEPTGYLYRIVRNLALDGRRRRSFEQRHFMEGKEEVAAGAASDSPSPEAAALSKDELQAVLQVLDGLPERMRIAVEMHRLDGAKLKDIAARLDISVTSAHELVAEGVQRCRLRLRSPV